METVWFNPWRRRSEFTEAFSTPGGVIDWPAAHADPVAGVTVQRGQTIDLYYNPVSTPFALRAPAGLTQTI